MSRLDDIISDLCLAIAENLSGSNGDNYRVVDVKQALKDLMLELIGDDEPVPTHYGKRVPISRSNTAFQMHYRNKLRAELRVKVEEL